jgi:hypothetical protein
MPPASCPWHLVAARTPMVVQPDAGHRLALGPGVLRSLAGERPRRHALGRRDWASERRDELKRLASGKNVTLPTELDAKHKAMQDKLSKMKGAAFDRAYMAHIVTAHQQ